MCFHHLFEGCQSVENIVSLAAAATKSRRERWVYLQLTPKTPTADGYHSPAHVHQPPADDAKAPSTAKLKFEQKLNVCAYLDRGFTHEITIIIIFAPSSCPVVPTPTDKPPRPCSPRTPIDLSTNRLGRPLFSYFLWHMRWLHVLREFEKQRRAFIVVYITA